MSITSGFHQNLKNHVTYKYVLYIIKKSFYSDSARSLSHKIHAEIADKSQVKD